MQFQQTLRFTLALAAAVTYAGARATEVPQETIDFAKVYWHQVSAPFGRFLLLRNAKGTCAVRFTEYQRMNDARSATTFSSGEETFAAAYEWYFSESPNGFTTESKVQHGVGTVATGRLVGIGRLAFQTRDPILRCGPFRNFWLQPGSVSFGPRIACKSATTELAPTQWQTLSELDASNSKLRWFGCDEKRQTIKIPASEL